MTGLVDHDLDLAVLPFGLGALVSVPPRLATGFYRIGANRRLPTFNYDRDILFTGM